MFGHARFGIAAMLFPVLMVAGCATQAPRESNQATPASTSASPPAATTDAALKSAGVGPTVVDQRPEADKVFEIHSLWITSCNYGVFTLPEKKTTKTHPDALQIDLAALPGDPWQGHQITVTHYAAYINAKHRLKGGVYAANQGLIPALMQGMGEKCSATEMQGGWYAATDVTNNNPPIVIEITAMVDGKSHTLRSVYSPSIDVVPKLKHDSDDHQLAAAIHKANLAFAALLNGGAVPVEPVGSSAASSTPTYTAPAPAAPTTSSAVMAAAQTPTIDNADMLGKAQNLSTQIGCGYVHATGATTFEAQCASYDVAIDCDGGQCRPLHTVKTASTQ
jgi:hypothetical protein